MPSGLGISDLYFPLCQPQSGAASVYSVHVRIAVRSPSLASSEERTCFSFKVQTQIPGVSKLYPPGWGDLSILNLPSDHVAGTHQLVEPHPVLMLWGVCRKKCPESKLKILLPKRGINAAQATWVFHDNLFLRPRDTALVWKDGSWTKVGRYLMSLEIITTLQCFLDSSF